MAWRADSLCGTRATRCAGEQGRARATGSKQNPAAEQMADKQRIARQVPEQTIYKSTYRRQQGHSCATGTLRRLLRLSWSISLGMGQIKRRAYRLHTGARRRRPFVQVPGQHQGSTSKVEEPTKTRQSPVHRPTDTVGRGLQGSFRTSKAEKVITGTNRSVTIPTRSQE